MALSGAQFVKEIRDLVERVWIQEKLPAEKIFDLSFLPN